jgi:hypothetical protein
MISPTPSPNPTLCVAFEAFRADARSHAIQGVVLDMIESLAGRVIELEAMVRALSTPPAPPPLSSVDASAIVAALTAPTT